MLILLILNSVREAHAFYWANRLLDNDINASQIEITMGPFSSLF